MTKDEALKLALAALEYHTVQTRPVASTEEAITAIEAALAQPEQDPPIEITSYIKGIYEYLESTSPIGFADEAFRLPIPASGALRQLFNACKSDPGRKCLAPAGQDRRDQSEDAPVLVQPEQEPVLWITPDGEGFRIRFSLPINDVPLKWDALYTTPPKREWVVLTDVEWEAMYDQFADYQEFGAFVSGWGKFARAVEAKLKEKNT